MSFGKFEGRVVTEWLSDDNGGDREMRLTEDFAYVEPNGKRWVAAKNSVVNGASIPRPLWSTVGSPYTDDYRLASVVHDVACADPNIDRNDSDVMFYSACRAGGCDWLQARTLYIGVRLGAWAHAALPPTELSPERLLFSVLAEGPPPESSYLKAKLLNIHEAMRNLPTNAGPAEFDLIIAAQLRVPEIFDSLAASESTATLALTSCSILNPAARKTLVRKAVHYAIRKISPDTVSITDGTFLGNIGLRHGPEKIKQYHRYINEALATTPVCRTKSIVPSAYVAVTIKTVGNVIDLVLTDLN